MARYSPIAPIQLLEEMYDRNILGNYLLLLAHDVLVNAERYENLIIKVREQDEFLEDDDDKSFIIMDNSVVELGKALGAEDVIEAACVVEASCIMTPDAMGSYEGTVVLLEDQAEELQNSGFPLMRVPQGNSYEQVAECINWIHDYLPVGNGEVEYWGIPRWIANRLDSRVPVASYINMTIPNARIHLLGMSEKYVDDRVCAGMKGVMGIDSANPVVMGMNGVDMLINPWMHIERRDYWDQTELTPEAILNIENMHNVL